MRQIFLAQSLPREARFAALGVSMLFLARTTCVWLLFVLASAAAPAWPHTGSNLQPDPDTTWAVMENGLRYAIRPNAEPKGRVTLRLVILAGSLRETEAQRGIAHFVEHMAFNGTQLFPKDTLIGILQRHGMAFGADLNAFTFPTHTIYEIEVPAGEPERLAEGFLVLREFASHITFDEDEVVRERAVIESERRARDNWQARRDEARTRFLHPGTLYAERAPIGLTEVIRKADAQALRDFYDTWYRPDNAVLFVVGDAPRDVLESQVHDKFSSWKAPSSPLPAPAEPGWSGNPAELTAALHTDEIGSGLNIELASVSELPRQPPNQALRRKNFEREIVLAMMQERMNELRRKNASEFGGAQAAQYANGSYRVTSLAISTAGVSWRQAVDAVGNEWERAAKLGFNAEELHATANVIKRRFDYARRAASTQSSAQVAGQMVGAFLLGEVYTNWDQQWSEAENVIRDFTPERALEVYLDLWRPGKPRLFASGNLQLAEAEKQLTQVFTIGQNSKLQPPPKPAAVILAYEPAASPGAIKQRRHVADLDLHLIEFANGIRLNLKPLATQRNFVSLRARVGWGQLALTPGQAGLGLIAGNYLDNAGLGRHYGDELQRYYAENNLHVDFQSEEDACTFTGSADRDGILQLLTVISASLNDPPWRPDSFVGAMRQTLAFYSEASHEPASAAASLAARVMSGDDRRFALPPPNATLQRDHSELMRWLETTLKNQPVEIGLVGDFDVEATLQAAALTLGALPPRPATRPLVQRGVKPVAFLTKPGRWQTYVDSDIPRAVVRVQWPATGFGDIHTRRRLEVLAGVLEERIRREIRQKQGFTYDPSAEVWNGSTQRDDGYLIVTLSVPPEEAQAISLKIVEQARLLSAQDATQDEVDAVVKPLLADNVNRLRDTGYWLYYIASLAQEEPSRLDWPRTRERDYLAMKADLINPLAKQFLSGSRAQIFVARPKETATAAK